MSESDVSRKGRTAHVLETGAINAEAMEALERGGIKFSRTPASMLDPKRASKAQPDISTLPLRVAEHWLMPNKKPHAAQCDANGVRVRQIKSFAVLTKLKP